MSAQKPSDLLETLAELPDEDLVQAVHSAAEIGENFEDVDKRVGRVRRRRTFRNIERRFYWFLFVIFCIGIAIVVIAFFSLATMYVRHLAYGEVLADPAAILDIITDVIWTVVVVLATLFVDRVARGSNE